MPATNPALAGLFQGDGLDPAGAGDEVFQQIGDFLGGASGVLRLELEPVPDAGVVAGGDNGGARRLMVENVEAEYGGRSRVVGKVGLDFVGGHHPGHCRGELPGQEPRVVAHHQALARAAGGPEIVGKTLGATAYVLEGKFLRDNGPPTVGAEAYGRRHAAAVLAEPAVSPRSAHSRMACSHSSRSKKKGPAPP